MTPEVERLREAIKRLHGCDSEHTGSAPVTETFQGQTVWDGVVEVFALIGHRSADTCYAWAYQDDGRERYFAVLKMPPVVSPEAAVRAVIISEFKSRLN